MRMKSVLAGTLLFLSFSAFAQETVKGDCIKEMSVALHNQSMSKIVLDARTPEQHLRQERKLSEVSGAFRTAQQAIAKFCEYVESFNN